MVEDIMLWVALIGIVVALIGGFAFPRTRPYIKKYWWVLVIASIGILSIVLFKNRSGGRIQDDLDEGRDIAKDNSDALSKVVEHAKEQMVLADTDLARARLREESAREQFDTQLEVAISIDDRLERRKALIKLVEGSKS